MKRRTRTRTHRCPPDHTHGASLTCGTRHGCGCDDCYDAQGRYREQRAKQVAYGRWDRSLLDRKPVIDHMNYLSENGIGMYQLARLAGISRGTLASIRRSYNNGTGTLIKPATAQAIMAVQPSFDLVAPLKHVSVLGARRRLQALNALGWPNARVAAIWGRTEESVNRINQKPYMTAEHYRQLVTIYDRLVKLDPRENGVTGWSFARTINRARKLNYQPPFAWDDIDNDPIPPVPEHVPYDEYLDEIAVELAITGRDIGRRLTPREMEEAVRLLHPKRMSDEAMSRVLGVARRTVERVRRDRLHLPAWEKPDQYVNVEKLRQEGQAA